MYKVNSSKKGKKSCIKMKWATQLSAGGDFEYVNNHKRCVEKQLFYNQWKRITWSVLLDGWFLKQHACQIVQDWLCLGFVIFFFLCWGCCGHLRIWNYCVYGEKKSIYGGMVCIEWEQGTILLFINAVHHVAKKNVNVCKDLKLWTGFLPLYLWLEILDAL